MSCTLPRAMSSLTLAYSARLTQPGVSAPAGPATNIGSARSMMPAVRALTARREVFTGARPTSGAADVRRSTDSPARRDAVCSVVACAKDASVALAYGQDVQVAVSQRDKAREAPSVEVIRRWRRLHEASAHTHSVVLNLAGQPACAGIASLRREEAQPSMAARACLPWARSPCPMDSQCSLWVMHRARPAAYR
jgi:hypothetical protein